jgi:transposase
MNEITTVGLDLAKRVVSVCGEDGSGHMVFQRTLRREAVLSWFALRPPCLVGMEACSSAHWFARELAALGHTARIIAPEFVRSFRLSGKNDANDAQAICAAVRQPQLRFVTVKSAEQQARLVVHRLRQGWQEERTASLNRLRGLLAEFGRVFANSAAAAVAGAKSVLADETLPSALRRGVARQLEHLRELEAHLAECDREIAHDAATDPRAAGDALVRCRGAHRQRGGGDGRRSDAVPLWSPVRGLAGYYPTPVLDRRSTAPGPHYPARRHLSAGAAGAGRALSVAGSLAVRPAPANPARRLDRHDL